ncbi:TetR/AcrR family transcriptional regulator C-terminal domain-containing protein [Streptomyces albidus (ex Kaewkla and Franco 2022)]|uniref:TetR/AcrR family transcriptional regulator C-terminal domain-containing protein n=1 Tax=Streptomyces albidus (ex Kaewkla and Franco 2022) TaxID=722709 RepID=UPI002815F9E1|nr:TetR/AcrR family transcriptional regulator C-terminal domain-containing protein [Streptomyces albidus (ex Kaewkla and Franco 2022)]
MARSKGQTALNRAQIVETGLRLLNEVGLDGLTLRRVAKELNVQAPALYWHVGNKQELLDEMATAMLREMSGGQGSDPPGSNWQELLAQAGRGLRRALLRYRDGAKVFAGTRLTDTGHAEEQEAHLRRLVAAGFSPDAAARASFIVFVFTEGFVIEQQAVHPMPGERAPGYDVTERAEALGPEFPLAAQAGADLFGDYDARFEEGLSAVIAGIGATLGPRTQS